MSVSQILSSAGTILPQYIDEAALTSGFVRNPMTSNLSCLNPTTSAPQEITQCSRLEAAVVQTDNISLVPGSLQTAVKFDDNVEFGIAKRIQFQGAGEVLVPSALSLSLTGKVELPDIDAAPTPLANVLAYNTTTNRVEFQAAGGGSTFRPAQQFFVAPNGNDTTGDGSATAPYATIQKAITEAELVATGSNKCLITVSAGVYTENLTFTTGYVWVQGAGSTTNKSTAITQITGDITVAVGGADSLNKTVSLTGFLIIGSITNSSTAQHSLSITDCSIFANDRCLYLNSSAATSRCEVYDCFINQDTGAATNPLIEVASGWLDIQRTPVSSNNNVSLLVVSGTGYLYKCALVPFENGSASATLAPLVAISSTAGTHNLFACSFVYTSGTNKTGSTSSSAVRFTAGNPTAILQNAFISLAGTSNPANHAVTTAAAGTIIKAANYCVPLYTDKVQGGITKVTLSLLT
jgi:hypothetical protein